MKFVSTADGANQKIEIPVWALSVDDWAILLHASEKTQVPIISRALELIQVFDVDDTNPSSLEVKNHIVATVVRDILSGPEGAATKSDKITAILKKFESPNFSLRTMFPFDSALDTVDPVPAHISITNALSISFAKMYAPGNLMAYCEQFIKGNINDLVEEKRIIPYSLRRFLEAIEFAVLYEGSVNSSRIHEYTATLITRLQHLIESEQGKFFAQTKYTSIKEYIESIIGDNQLLNIDICSLDDTATEVITKVFSKLLFDYLRNLSPRNSMPVNLIEYDA